MNDGEPAHLQYEWSAREFSREAFLYWLEQWSALWEIHAKASRDMAMFREELRYSKEVRQYKAGAGNFPQAGIHVR